MKDRCEPLEPVKIVIVVLYDIGYDHDIIP